MDRDASGYPPPATNADRGTTAESAEAPTWDKTILDRIAQLDLEAEFTAAGTPWAELDAHGQVVVRVPGKGGPVTRHP